MIKCDICGKDVYEEILSEIRKPDIELFVRGCKQKMCDECFGALVSWRLRHILDEKASEALKLASEGMLDEARKVLGIESPSTKFKSNGG